MGKKDKCKFETKIYYIVCNRERWEAYSLQCVFTTIFSKLKRDDSLAIEDFEVYYGEKINIKGLLR